MQNGLFQRYLNLKKKNNEKIYVYLKSNQNVSDRHKEGKINNLMLSGEVEDVDESSLLLRNQECLIPLSSILSIKPARY